MLHEPTMHKLFAMKLNGMAGAYEEQLQQSQMGELSFEDRYSQYISEAQDSYYRFDHRR
jgi:hypothetical protein